MKAQMDEITRQLRAATTKLEASTEWRQMLAENLFWASCEGFLQSSLLWAVNQQSTSLFADREKKIAGTAPVDLVLFERAVYADYLSARGERLAALCRALVQLKVVWTKGNATGSAVASEKAKSVLYDAVRLAEVCRSNAGCTGVLGVLVAGRHPAGKAGPCIDEAFGKVHAALEGSIVGEPEGIDVLVEEVVGHWATLDTAAGNEGEIAMSARLWFLAVA